MREAAHVHVTGIVQGVGFRPFVHGLADRYALAGWVRNGGGDVEIAVEGAPAAIDGFLDALTAEAPPLARIDTVHAEPDRAAGLDRFRILASEDAADARQPVAPDVSMCDACARELADPADRRFGYPFITCTDCGPRYSVIESMPYDRERTSMRAFAQCAECRREYETPGGRRYHSETNSCPACGPSPDGRVPVTTAAAFLRWGAIVAVRGVGGFHLAVDATNERAVRRLRLRKGREAKPLAVMVRSLDEARAIAEVGPDEERWLLARERPIVLLRRRPDAPLAPSVAPGLDTVGVMLAYTPLHLLLLQAAGRALVMTSGNLSDEPLAAGVDEAIERLGDVADAFLVHDREIVARVDDSVMRVAGGAPVMLRRARGWAPVPVESPVESPVPLLAVGAHLKNTFALMHGRHVYPSAHVGDLDTVETLAHWRAQLARLGRLYRTEPRAVARDLHPGYPSTRIADELALEMELGRPIVVQHHHAHIAAVMAEHGERAERGPVLGVAFDGTGYGDDGHTWGAELLLSDLTGYRRLGQLRYAPMPGGDLAARLPWRAALGYLSLEPALAPAFARAFAGVEPEARQIADVQISRRLNAPLASSMGRLFDAAAAVLGLRHETRYEGEAAIALESLAGRRRAASLPFPASHAVTPAGERWTLDPLPLLAALGERATAGGDVAELAAAFHESIAAGTADLVDRICLDAGVGTVVLGGGVFQNARLLAALRGRLEGAGFRVLCARRLPPNDGGVSYGQAVVAAARLGAGLTAEPLIPLGSITPCV